MDDVAKSLPNQNAHRKDITVYKLGEFVDMSNGPMISNTSLIGRFNMTNLFKIESPKYGKIHRAQGISIPSQLQLHSWTYDLLVERATTPSLTKPSSDKVTS